EAPAAPTIAAPASTAAPATTAATILPTTVPPTASPTTASPTTAAAATVPQPTVPSAEPIRVLVTNDDGYSAEGIDAVVQALLAFDVPVFEVTVVAPLTPQSGQGGNFTDGPVVATDVTTLSGHPAIAVEGFPADTVRWALDQGGIGFIPDFVISGTNEGQNLGPFVDVSGTVGAARAAAVRNVPAIAISTGFATFDYEATIDVLLEYLAGNLGTLLAHEPGAPVAEVISINVPSCSVGEVRGLVDVPLGTDLQGFDYGSDVDCSSTAENPADDVQAFFTGFATVSPTPLEPAAG
ncbi:MAG TPA: 5'/3'-nucleotidase SurE, partial [Ilumatobacter sp.]|nr:5'/3'-nucleotidase SurE [Ilumatobacter sp.]